MSARWSTSVAHRLLRRHIGRASQSRSPPASASSPSAVRSMRPRAFAIPKSVTTAVPPDSRMFSGLMSRCTTPSRMRKRERARHVAQNRHTFRRRKGAVRIEMRPQGLALHERHRVVRDAARIAGRQAPGRCWPAGATPRDGSRGGIARHSARPPSRVATPSPRRDARAPAQWRGTRDSCRRHPTRARWRRGRPTSSAVVREGRSWPGGAGARREAKDASFNRLPAFELDIVRDWRGFSPDVNQRAGNRDEAPRPRRRSNSRHRAWS